MNTASQNFGRRLRQARERLGISLEAIAASSKISRSLLADLERGDVSKWPGGIYRRAFVREYAAAIGLPAKAVVAEFVDIFPEEGTPAATASLGMARSADLRLTLDVGRNEALIATVRRLAIAAAELCAVLGVGWLVATFARLEFWMVCGAIALTYYPLAAACSTRIPIVRWPAVRALFTMSGPRYDVPSSSELVQLVLHQAPVPSTDERTA
jgi:transcriptional regulator with XRE-family HTH domain